VTALADRWRALPPNLRGILWVGLSGLLFALLNVFTLIPAEHLNTYVMAFLRYCAGTLILLPLILRIGPYRALHSHRKGLHIGAARSMPAACSCGSPALPITGLAEITALGFTGPIFITIGAALFLGEDVEIPPLGRRAGGLRRRHDHRPPGLQRDRPRGDLHPGLDPDLLASNLISKALARTEGPETIVIWQHLVIVVFAAPVALWFWQTPTWVDLLWFLAAGLCGTAGTSASSAAISSPTSPCCSRSVPVAAVERAARLLPVRPAARCLDLRRRGGDLLQRPLHLPPRGGSAGQDQELGRAGRARDLIHRVDLEGYE
jgi:fumarate reductase subunit D